MKRLEHDRQRAKLQELKSNESIPEDVSRVLVMGCTGAGKSMLVNALADKQLQVVVYDEGKKVVEAVSSLPALKIGHTVQSETTCSAVLNECLSGGL